MFIKKDQRKIPEILEDSNDDRTDLFLARRSPEFQGTIKVLVDSTTPDKFKNTQYLSLNANMLHSIEGIQMFSQSPLHFLSLSNNKLSSLSPDISLLTSLESLIIEDNLLSSFPQEIRRLTNLKTLRLTGNKFKEVPEWIGEFQLLEVLALDNCEIHTIPLSLSSLIHLKTLLLGNNEIQSIPSLQSLQNLTMLCINSNNLINLPQGIALLSSLTTIYANNNKIQDIEANWAQKENLELFDLRYNQIKYLPSSVRSKWISDGTPIKGISLDGNPILDILASEAMNLEDEDPEVEELDNKSKRIKY